MLYGLMYFTYDSATEHKYLIRYATDYKWLLKWRNRKPFQTRWTILVPIALVITTWHIISLKLVVLLLAARNAQLPSPSPFPSNRHYLQPIMKCFEASNIFHLPQLQTQLVASFLGPQMRPMAVGVLSVMVAVSTCVWALREVIAVSVDLGIGWSMESTA